MRRILEFFLIVMSALIGFLFAGAAWGNRRRLGGDARAGERKRGSGERAFVWRQRGDFAETVSRRWPGQRPQLLKMRQRASRIRRTVGRAGRGGGCARRGQSGGWRGARGAGVQALLPLQRTIRTIRHRLRRTRAPTQPARIIFGVRADAQADEMDPTKQEEALSNVCSVADPLQRIS